VAGKPEGLWADLMNGVMASKPMAMMKGAPNGDSSERLVNVQSNEGNMTCM